MNYQQITIYINHLIYITIHFDNKQYSMNMYILLASQQLERKLELLLGKKENWTDREFNSISEKIYSVTACKLSKDTLKRIFGRVIVPGNYIPQKDTLDAIVRYLGYDNWYSFEQSMDNEKPFVATEEGQSQDKKVLGGGGLIKKSIIVVLASTLLLPLVYFYPFLYDLILDPPIALEVQFNTNVVPCVATIKYDCSKRKSNNLELFTGILLRKNEISYLLPSKKGIIYQSYSRAGLFDIQIKQNNRCLKSAPVFIKSKEWVAVVENEKNSVDLLQSESKKQQGIFSVSKAKAFEVLNDTIGFYKTQFQYANDFKIDGDNSTVELRLKNHIVKSKSFYCNYVFLIVCYEFVKVRVKLVDFVSGDREFVSFETKNGLDRRSLPYNFPIKFDDWYTVKYTTKNGGLSIYYNNKLKTTQSYRLKLGKPLSIFIQVNNSGELDYFSMSDNKGGTYREDF